MVDHLRMDLALTHVNATFLEEVAFPAFEVGLLDAEAGLRQLLAMLSDEAARTSLELLLQEGVEGSIKDWQSERWQEAVHRLLFSTWAEAPQGWNTTAGAATYVASAQDAMHLALMLESATYPYWSPEKSLALREVCWKHPEPDGTLASLVAGCWHPFPAFPPDQILRTVGRATYDPDEKLALADWTYRPPAAVAKLSAQLPYQLSRLARREVERLRPLDVPEWEEVVAYWNGQVKSPPLLPVMFSGLGRDATHWVRQIGDLAAQLRTAAQLGHALVALVARSGATLSEAQ